jgi:hypothetical protein
MNSKIKDFVHQITFLRVENERKNILADSVAQKLATAENERDEYMRHYLKLKKENKALKKNINLVYILFDYELILVLRLMRK